MRAYYIYICPPSQEEKAWPWMMPHLLGPMSFLHIAAMWLMWLELREGWGWRGFHSNPFVSEEER